MNHEETPEPNLELNLSIRFVRDILEGQTLDGRTETLIVTSFQPIQQLLRQAVPLEGLEIVFYPKK